MRDPKNSIFNDFEAEKKILPSLPLDQLCAQFIAEIDFWVFINRKKNSGWIVKCLRDILGDMLPKAAD